MFFRFLICVSLCGSAAFSDLLIRDVAIVDVAAGRATAPRSILIRGGKIAAIGAALHAPASVRVIDGRGKLVIPGLWDMHVHLAAREELPAYLHFGVTGVRDMGSDYDRVNLWRALLGPHIETCGPALNGVASANVRVVRSPEEARTVFNQLDDESVDFIGILPELPRDAYFALTERARKYYSAVAGDVPVGVSALEAVEARQKSIDHMPAILLACSSEERRLRQAYLQALERGDLSALEDVQTAALDSYDPRKAAILFQRMALFETRFVPTLGGTSAKFSRVLGDMLRAGVVILAGSDGGKPGQSLHEELEMLVASGLTPALALRGATLEAARYVGAAGLGSVEVGNAADLVILDADPLRDIRNTRKIAGVVLGGRYRNWQTKTSAPR